MKNTNDGGATPTKFTALLLCSANLPDKIAISVDAQTDDGTGKKGTVRGQKQAAPNEAIAAAGKCVQLMGKSSLTLGRLGSANAQAGNVVAAEGVLQEMDELSARRHVSPYHLALVHCSLGRIEKALDLLEPQSADADLPLRFCVQDVYRFDERRIIAGRVETGAQDRAVAHRPAHSCTRRCYPPGSWPS